MIWRSPTNCPQFEKCMDGSRVPCHLPWGFRSLVKLPKWFLRCFIVWFMKIPHRPLPRKKNPFLQRLNPILPIWRGCADAIIPRAIPSKYGVWNVANTKNHCLDKGIISNPRLNFLEDHFPVTWPLNCSLNPPFSDGPWRNCRLWLTSDAGTPWLPRKLCQKATVFRSWWLLKSSSGRILNHHELVVKYIQQFLQPVLQPFYAMVIFHSWIISAGFY